MIDLKLGSGPLVQHEFGRSAVNSSCALAWELMRSTETLSKKSGVSLTVTLNDLILISCIFPSEIMSLLFADLDLVPSDIAAGLIVLNLKAQGVAQRRTLVRVDNEAESNENLHHDGQTNFRLASISVQSDPWNTPHRISHFMKYALGSYVCSVQKFQR